MPGPANPLYRTAAWRRLARARRKRAAAANEPCSICGQDIDYTITGNRAAGAATIDHPHPIALGGDTLPDIAELGVAHRRCQQKQGGHVAAVTRAARKGQQGTSKPRTPPPPARLPNPGFDGVSGAPSVFKAAVTVSARAATLLIPGAAGNGRLVESRPSDDDGTPRFMSGPHPDAVATLADEWVPWLESDGAIVLRPWQRLVLARALEVDAAGVLCWPVVVVSTARQLGKSWLARAGITARAEHGPRLWGEPQECLHVANALVAARRIHTLAWRWAEARGLDVRKAMGNERIIWPDSSHWSLVASKSAWGASGSVVYADEAWDIAAEVIDEGLEPTLVERTSPQLWLSSTANDEATSLMLNRRREGLAGGSGTMLAEWSVPDGVDEWDPAVWRRWSPHWSPQRQVMMSRVAERARVSPQVAAAFRSQWLNRWPARADGVERQWPDGWDGLPRVAAAMPPAGGVAAVESTVDQSHFGTAVAVAEPSGRVLVWTARHTELAAAVAWVEARSPERVVVGLSLARQVLVAVPMDGYGASHTLMASPMLENLVRRGLLAHDHGESMAAQTRGARVVQSERGMYLSGKASAGPVDVVKAVAWAVLAAATVPVQEAPAIW